jgi:molecular chaperone GrpE
MSDGNKKNVKKPTAEDLAKMSENLDFLMEDSTDDKDDYIADLESDLRKALEANQGLAAELVQVPQKIAEAEAAQKDRADREIATAKKYAAAGIAKDLFDLADNFQRAAEAITPEMRKDPQIDAIAEGFVALKAQLVKAFAKHGIEQIEAKGAKFDPNVHEAVMNMPADENTQPGHVALVMQEGYKLHDRLLRPARVAVAKKL